MLEAQYKEKFKSAMLRRLLPRILVLALLVSWFGAGCESAIAPPAAKLGGTLKGVINYSGSWPGQSEVRDLRFVALRFVPVDTTDFLQLNRMEVSQPLMYGVESDTFSIADVEPGVFPFSGVARQITDNIFSWAPVGLVVENDGIIELREGETVTLVVEVDFNNIPPFPKSGVDGAQVSVRRGSR